MFSKCVQCLILIEKLNIQNKLRSKELICSHVDKSANNLKKVGTIVYSRCELSKDVFKTMRESSFLKLSFSEILHVPMPRKQVTLLVSNISTNFNIIASDSDLVLNFSFLGFRAIIINLITLRDDIFLEI